jgi:short subunit dehydrogenase-like uncharacterized protein
LLLFNALVFTPSPCAAMGTHLIERLRKAGLTFNLLPDKEAAAA